jgi:hypothetical protein
MHHLRFKNSKIFWGGAKPPPQTPQQGGGTASPHPTPVRAFGASIVAPLVD